MGGEGTPSPKSPLLPWVQLIKYMAGNYKDAVANSAIQGQVAITVSSWVPLIAGSAGVPYEARRHVRYQLKSNAGGTMALQYVLKNLDGTFTTPTSASVKTSTTMPGNATWIEPIGDSCMVYGKLVKKAGFTFNSARCIVTEFR